MNFNSITQSTCQWVGEQVVQDQKERSYYRRRGLLIFSSLVSENLKINVKTLVILIQGVIFAQYVQENVTNTQEKKNANVLSITYVIGGKINAEWEIN